MADDLALPSPAENEQQPDGVRAPDWEFSCPEGWELLHRWGDGYALRQKGGGLRVLIDCESKDSRKAASAEIAKIPFPLAQHIARVFKPESTLCLRRSYDAHPFSEFQDLTVREVMN